jgi:hypothetical protein
MWVFHFWFLRESPTARRSYPNQVAAALTADDFGCSRAVYAVSTFPVRGVSFAVSGW